MKRISVGRKCHWLLYLAFFTSLAICFNCCLENQGYYLSCVYKDSTLYLHMWMRNACTTIARTGYLGHFQGWAGRCNKTGGPIGSSETSLIFTATRSPQCSEVLIYELVIPMRWGSWGTSSSDSIKISVLDSWPLDSPPPHLVNL